MERVGHDSGIPPIVSKCRKLSVISNNAEPCSVFVIFVQNFLLSGSCLDLQDSLDFPSDTTICFFVRNWTGPWSSLLSLMRWLLFPTASAVGAFADIAVFSICTVSVTLIAELIARILLACASALGRLGSDVSGKVRMSADVSTAG